MVRGFTLVELMVTLAVAAVLLMVAAPFTLGWSDGQRQLRARAALAEATGAARAMALRNENGFAPGMPVACVRATEGPELEVVVLAAGQRCLSGTAVRWSGALHPRVSLADATGAAFVCVAYGSRGAHADPALAPECTLATRLSVVVGDPREAVDVELL